MTAPGVRVIERHSIVTPLGVQFVDDFSGAPVASGLEVWTWQEATPARRVVMHPAGAATYAAHRLPGLSEFEAGSGDDDFWDRWRAEPPRRFVVEARDLRARFLPMQVRVDLPAFGVARPACPLLPPNRRHAVPLFSASTRAVVPTVAVVHADLYDRSARRPAAWAVAEARFDGRAIARGMADREGRLILLLPYPEPQASWTSPPAAPTSPPSPPKLPLAQQSWSVEIAVRYERTPSIPDVPDLCGALAQPPVQLLADAGSPSQRLTEITLRYGERAVLRTANTGGEERGRVLVITSGSPL